MRRREVAPGLDPTESGASAMRACWSTRATKGQREACTRAAVITKRKTLRVRLTARKNRRHVAVLIDVPAKTYGNERLAHLLRLLRPAPSGWVMRARRVFVDRSLADRPLSVGGGLTERDLAQLGHALQNDRVFQGQFDADPVAAAEAAGMHELAAGLKREMRELIALAERVARDDAYRSELEADPIRTLDSAGVPAEIAEPLLHALAVPDDVLARLPDVVAHEHQQLSLKARLLTLLLGSTAVTAKIHVAARRA